MLITAMKQRIRLSRKRLMFGLSLGLAGLMMLWSGFSAMTVIVMLVLIVLLLRFATRPASRAIARIGSSIRWKFEVGIAVIAGLFLVISLVNFGAMDFMHTGLHEIQDTIDAGQMSQARIDINDLEDTHHGFLFSMTPIVSVLAVLLAATLGAAMAWSVVDPVGRMGQAMRRIASGNFSEPVRVDNQDELGELADRINHTSDELEELQEATLAEERARALRERITRVTLAHEEERRRLSRELHDGLGPSLAAIGNRIRTCQLVIRSDPQEAERGLEEITRSLKGHVQEVRELIYDLRPLALDQLGLMGAINQQAERLRQETGVQVFVGGLESIELNPLVEVTLFRVLQECLTNVQKHADASTVDVKLQIMDNDLEVRVKDDGRGFDTEKVASGAVEKGIGLVSMRERAELLGGSLSVQSSPGNGCEIVLCINSGEARDGAHSSPGSG